MRHIKHVEGGRSCSKVWCCPLVTLSHPHVPKGTFHKTNLLNIQSRTQTKIQHTKCLTQCCFSSCCSLYPQSHLLTIQIINRNRSGLYTPGAQQAPGPCLTAMRQPTMPQTCASNTCSTVLSSQQLSTLLEVAPAWPVLCTVENRAGKALPAGIPLIANTAVEQLAGLALATCLSVQQLARWCFERVM